MRGRLKWQGNGCDIAYSYYFGSDMEANQATPRCTAQYPLFQTISLQREGLEATIVCLCQVRGMRTPKELKWNVTLCTQMFTNNLSAVRFISNVSLSSVNANKRFNCAQTSNSTSNVIYNVISLNQCAEWGLAMRPRLQHSLENGGCSNCSGAELFSHYDQVERKVHIA